MTASIQQPRPEFSRCVPVDSLGDEPVDQDIEATAEERAGLARRFGLVSLDRLRGRLRLHRASGGALVRVEGRLEAVVTQACVVTLEPVESKLEASFSLLYGRAAGTQEGGGHEVVIDPEAEDAPEPIGPGGIDLGEAVAQQLALALDPYPRGPNARLARSTWGGEAGTGREAGPFAALEALKRRG